MITTHLANLWQNIFSLFFWTSLTNGYEAWKKKFWINNLWLSTTQEFIMIEIRLWPQFQETSMSYIKKLKPRIYLFVITSKAQRNRAKKKQSNTHVVLFRILCFSDLSVLLYNLKHSFFCHSSNLSLPHMSKHNNIHKKQHLLNQSPSRSLISLLSKRSLRLTFW